MLESSRWTPSWRALRSWHTAALLIYYVALTAAFAQDTLKGIIAAVIGLFVFRAEITRLLKIFLFESWRQIDAEADAPKKTAGDLQPLLVYAVAAVSLLCINYWGHRDTYVRLAHEIEWLPKDNRFNQLFELGWWSLSRVFCYVAVPTLAMRIAGRQRLRDCGLSIAGFVGHLKIYGLLYLLILPPVIVASYTKPFLHTYPFYGHASRSWVELIIWETLYVVQFFALELFFRGFMLHPLKQAMGPRAIVAMALPYCMIHFRKPIAEAAGAFVAGTVLGTLSMRTRSIWAGVLIHATVALTMDLLALTHGKGLPTMWWPGG